MDALELDGVSGAQRGQTTDDRTRTAGPVLGGAKSLAVSANSFRRPPRGAPGRRGRRGPCRPPAARAAQRRLRVAPGAGRGGSTRRKNPGDVNHYDTCTAGSSRPSGGATARRSQRSDITTRHTWQTRGLTVRRKPTDACSSSRLDITRQWHKCTASFAYIAAGIEVNAR